MIRIVDYDPDWPRRFGDEAALLRAQLGAQAMRIEHVGSTSVPGLGAKPVIDIQVSVASLQPFRAFAAPLTRLGYTFISHGEFDKVYPFFQKPPVWPSSHHVHVCEAGGEQERLHLAFRDALRADAAMAAEYEQLKRRLAAGSDGSTFAGRERYSLAKTDFIRTVLARVR